MWMDDIIVGSGLSGLVYAALAAKAGRRVCVLEAHTAPGGYGHTFVVGKPPNEHRFNAQLHYVWNCGPGRTVDSVLRKLDLHHAITFESLDPNGFDRMRVASGLTLDIPSDPDELLARLCALFPEDRDAFDGFLSETLEVAESLQQMPSSRSPLQIAWSALSMRKAWRWRNATLQDAFDHFELPLGAQTLLALQWPDFLLPPNQLSYLAWCSLFVGYMDGAWYPTKHFEHVVEQLVHTIEEHGGQVLLGHAVNQFVHLDDRVQGVVAERTDGSLRRFDAERVICNMDPQRAAEMIGMEHFSPAVRRQLDYTYSASNLAAYVVVEDLDFAAHGFGRHNLFHAEDLDLNGAFEDMTVRGDYHRVSFAMSVPSLLTKDRTDRPEGRTIVEFVTVASYERWLDLKLARGRTYDQEKKAVLERILDIVERDYIPGFREHIRLKVVGSPTTNQRYCGSPRGNSYGSALTPGNIGLGRLGADSSIEGLYFCNASSGFPGFAGTFWTGASLYETLNHDPVLTGPHVLTATGRPTLTSRPSVIL